MDDITGRIKGKNGIVEGKNKIVRVQSWYKHYRQLLDEEVVTGKSQQDTIEFQTGELDMEKSKNR